MPGQKQILEFNYDVRLSLLLFIFPRRSSIRFLTLPAPADILSFRIHSIHPVSSILLTRPPAHILQPSNNHSVEALASRTQTQLLWSPVLLGAIYRQTAAPQGAAGSASDVFNTAKKAVSSKAIDRTLSRYKIPFNQPAKHPNKTTAALRLIYSLPNEERPALTKALFKAYWVDDQDVSNPAILKAIASQYAISEPQTDTPALRATLEDATLKAVARGAPGVPSFWLPGETWTDNTGKPQQGRLYWGQDRMHFVEAVLMALNKGVSYHQVPNLGGLQPRCLHSPRPSKPTKLEFYYDFSSPWAFLGWTQLARMQREAGPMLEIELKPFLLGALFREFVHPSMFLPAPFLPFARSFRLTSRLLELAPQTCRCSRSPSKSAHTWAKIRRTGCGTGTR
jgi:2-hydroxychromene-2-carboxylate isomerase